MLLRQLRHHFVTEIRRLMISDNKSANSIFLRGATKKFLLIKKNVEIKID